MAAEFWAGYVSGAAGILIGNPLDLIKTRLQNTTVTAHHDSGTSQEVHLRTADAAPRTFREHFDRAGTLARGTTFPLLTYGFLNALLYSTYNRSLSLLQPSQASQSPSLVAISAPVLPTLPAIFLAGSLAGLTTFLISTPTELIKVRAQIQVSSGSLPSTSPLFQSTPSLRNNSGTPHTSPTVPTSPATSVQIASSIYRTSGIRGFYQGGAVTSVRDAVGYGFYFLTYEWLMRTLAPRTLVLPAHTSNSSVVDDAATTSGEASHTSIDTQHALAVLFCGGLAGIATWTSIFPLDVIKTRIQAASSSSPLSSRPQHPSVIHPSPPPAHRPSARDPLLHPPLSSSPPHVTPSRPKSAFAIAAAIYRAEGPTAFFRGWTVCSVRAFVVNAVQWGVYEWMMRAFRRGA